MEAVGQMLHCQLSPEKPENLFENDTTLAVVCRGDAIESADPRLVSTHLPVLHETALHEIWLGDAIVSSGQEGHISFASTSHVMFLSAQLDNTEALTDTVKSIYQQLISTAYDKGFPHIIRAWNYFADINQGEGYEERYKQFCTGRHLAFESAGIDPAQYPAASALGHASGKIVIYMLCAKKPGIHIENPDQESAYNYPRQYGPKSPSFARVTVCPGLDQSFISGTASIAGHQTMHIGELKQQLELTLSNIERLAEHIRTRLLIKAFPQLFKVYLRHPSDLEAISQILNARYPNTPPSASSDRWSRGPGAPWRPKTPDALPSPILRRLSRSRLAAPRQAARRLARSRCRHVTLGSSQGVCRVALMRGQRSNAF